MRLAIPNYWLSKLLKYSADRLQRWRVNKLIYDIRFWIYDFEESSIRRTATDNWTTDNRKKWLQLKNLDKSSNRVFQRVFILKDQPDH